VEVTPSVTRRVVHVAVAVALCATAACDARPDDALQADDTRSDVVSDDQSPKPDASPVLTVAEAASRTGERVTVRGWLVDDGGTTVLAAMLAESYPPQAGGDTLVVTDPRLGDEVALESASGVRWSADQVLVTGVVRDGELTDASVRPDLPPDEGS
jgi:hypothetical protein